MINILLREIKSLQLRKNIILIIHKILNVEQIKEKLLELEYVQNELKEWNKKIHVMN